MDCASCGHPNRANARFCAECATPLARPGACPSCGTTHPPGAKFCDGCGERLAGAEAGAPGPAQDPRPQPPEHLAAKVRAGQRALEGERKQVTVLFADVLGSLELAERSDPEEWRRTMDRFVSILSAGVHRFEGTVDKFTGDGIMALFGAPIAHEDHAQRACYAALHLQDELAAYAAELRHAEGLGLSVRMGLNSGEVVVGAIGADLGMAYTAIGHTVGLAQRMEQLAEPGKVYVSEHTAALAEGHLELVDLGEFRVKGVSGMVRVHELTGLGRARGRLDVARARGFSRFVGRDDELGVLERALEQAAAGQGQVIGIVGEAGVGKSRLCHEFAERCRARGTPVYHVAGQAHTKSVPLLPVLEFLRNFFDITAQDSDRKARERIAGKLLLLDESFADDLPLLFDFLAVPDPERPLPRMDPEARGARLLALMQHLSHAESARAPGVVVFEDLHWLDPASELFVTNRVDAAQGTRSLTLLNFRPEYRAPWMSRSYYRQLALAPLDAAATEAMLSELLGSDPSLDGLSQLIRQRTQDNPFFIEELVRSLVESGCLDGAPGSYRLVCPVDEATVPASVQAVLAARIDRLATHEKAVLQAAAVIGKEFSAAVLTRVVGSGAPNLEGVLRALVAGEFLYEHAPYPEARFAFKHPLTQEVAYGSQLADRRAATHAAVARAIAEQYPERLDERAALLAQHWEAAREPLDAARWNARAAAWAGFNDPREAVRHWQKVRELADALPESAETAALGLTARAFELHFGWRLGISAEQAAAAFTEAERMASKTGDLHIRTILLLDYAAIRGVGDGDVHECARLARASFALAEESGDPALYVTAALGAYAFLGTGEYGEGTARLDRAIEVAGGDPTVGAGIGFACPYAMGHVFKGGFLLALGELEEAGRVLERGRRIAREQADLETAAYATMWLGQLAYWRGDAETVLTHGRQALELAEQIGGWHSRCSAWNFLGLAELMRGEWAAAVEALERSVQIARERRTTIDWEGWRLAMLGEAHLGAGDADRARRYVDEGLAIARAQRNPFHETHACLAQARVLLGSAGVAERAAIEGALARALELTEATGARVFAPLIHLERAELARLGGDPEAREAQLREAHRLFTEIGATGHVERLELELPTVRR